VWGSLQRTALEFTCFTSTKVHILTPEALRARQVQQRYRDGVGRRYSVYWLYWYKSTTTDAEGDGRLQGLRSREVPRASRSIRCRCTQFTCFTSTKVQILTPLRAAKSCARAARQTRTRLPGPQPWQTAHATLGFMVRDIPVPAYAVRYCGFMMRRLDCRCWY
jgi:hypothetical protein